MSAAWEAIFLGLVQGLTEFFPVSSSAHLIAAREVLGVHGLGLAFDAILHLATLLAVVYYFRRDLLGLFTSALLGPVLLRIVVAAIPVLVAGFVFSSVREKPAPWSAAVGWMISAAYLLASRNRAGSSNHENMPIRYALVIGLAQCFSLWPGVSRSGTTITAALCLGLARSPAARFSFLLSIPVLLASAAYEILKAWREPAEETGTFLSLGFAMPVAFLAGLFTIHFLLRAVASNHFHRFGWYNLLAALAFSAFLLFR